jgi:hypothetical protein
MGTQRMDAGMRMNERPVSVVALMATGEGVEPYRRLLRSLRWWREKGTDSELSPRSC